MGRKYQYHIYNDFFSLLVTVQRKNDEYAIQFCKSVARDFYGLRDEYLQDVKCKYITEFSHESVVNLNMLKTK